MALENNFSVQKAKTTTFEGALSVKTSGSDQPMNLTYKGAAALDGPFTLSASLDALVTNVTLDARSADGNTFYFKVGGLSGLPQLLGASDDAQGKAEASLLAGLNDQWIQVNQSMIKQLTGDTTDVNTSLSDADRKALTNVYKKH